MCTHAADRSLKRRRHLNTFLQGTGGGIVDYIGWEFVPGSSNIYQVKVLESPEKAHFLQPYNRSLAGKFRKSLAFETSDRPCRNSSEAYQKVDVRLQIQAVTFSCSSYSGNRAQILIYKKINQRVQTGIFRSSCQPFVASFLSKQQFYVTEGSASRICI